MHRRDTYLLLRLALALAASAQCVVDRQRPAPGPPREAPPLDDDAWLEGITVALTIDDPDLRIDLPVDLPGRLLR